MSRTTLLRLLAVICSVGLFAAACGGDDDDAGGDGGEGGEAAQVDAAAVGLWDDGECDASLPELKLGLQTVFSSPVLTLEDQAQALEASAEAFNGRGGANGHCIAITTCDDGADPNRALDCVRTLDEAGVVATVNDTTPVASKDVSAAYAAAGISRFAISPAQDDYPDLNSYPFDAGGVGTSLMMPQSLLDEEVTKVAVIRVDLPAGSALSGLFKAVYTDDGMEFVADIPVPAGTTDYSQFILAAQEAGAEGVVMPLGGQEGIQVLRAAAQLDSDLLFATSLGSLPYSSVAELGDFAENVILNAANPPATVEDPVVELLAADLGASGVEALELANLKTSPMRSWIGLYALLAIIRADGTEEFTREGVKALIDGAGEIDMLGLTGDWTPGAVNAGAFPRSGNGFYSFWRWDSEASFGDEAGNLVKTSDGNFIEVICGSPIGGPCA